MAVYLRREPKGKGLINKVNAHLFKISFNGVNLIFIYNGLTTAITTIRSLIRLGFHSKFDKLL